MKSILLAFLATYSALLFAQDGNVGIGTLSPTQKLEVNGNVKCATVIANAVSAGTMGSGSIFTNGLTLNGGLTHDFVKCVDDNGAVGFRKGHQALALRYIIAVGGTVPQTTGTPNYSTVFVGEVKLFAGVIAPAGWMFCDGQLLAKTSYPDLFNVIGNTYGGGGPTFALPDLKSRVPVGTGTSITGLHWDQGEFND